MFLPIIKMVVKKMNNKMQSKITFCICVVLLMLVMPFLPVRGEGEIYDNTLRLHVLANSDSEEDQNLKLLVRDAIVEKTAFLANECRDIESAKKIYSDNLSTLKMTAEKVIEEQGYNYPVNVTLGEEYYPERQYESVRLPSGRYTSLKVNIGESEGQNWWCVLFPPLCVEASEAEEEFVQTGFTPNQIKVLTDSETPKYVIRFRILEWAESIFEKFR
ncbi:MAG: stage II sporulation protein R [Ruminococcaceae bacterium]|nr:stage II sporulation protein R [Oscillospiraceae bacterium]